MKTLLLLFLAPALVFAAADDLPPKPFPPAVSVGGTKAVATFECVGLYWSLPGGADSLPCAVSYRASGDAGWSDALPLGFDSRNGEYRGSVVGLRPGTAYEFRLARKDGAAATVAATTWKESFPVARVVTVPSGAAPYEIREGGSPGGYVVYAAAPGGTTIDAAGKSDSCVTVSASYVIVRGLALKNAARDGLLLSGPVHDVVVEGCDISGWGRIAKDGWGENLDAAVRADSSGIERIVVQRCRLHDPRSNANDWSQPRVFGTRPPNPHPIGPQAIVFIDPKGNNVLRDNEVFSDEAHRFNDGIGGGDNFSYEGFPGPDSDVCGNVVRNAADDALEIEGGGRNVRVWGNFMDHVYTGVSSAANSVGPLYVFRNVLGVCRKTGKAHVAGPDENWVEADDHGVFGKLSDAQERVEGGFRTVFGGGRRYFLHNTTLQPPDPGGGPTLGARAGIGRWSGAMINTVSRNNVWQAAQVPPHGDKQMSWSVYDVRRSPTNDLDYDLCDNQVLVAPGQESHTVVGAPVYAPGSGPGAMAFFLALSSPGAKAGERLPNFDDAAPAGRAPDMGAQQSDAPPLEFGVHAYEPPPVPAPPSASAPLKPVRVVVVGDSTVSVYAEQEPTRGWGQFLSEALVPAATVMDRARPGRSTKTFRAEGFWDQALADKPDFVLIQFGHNDAHAKDRPEATDAATEYPENLRRYVAETRGAGAVPILVTPMHRRTYKDGRLTGELARYAAAMERVGAETGTPVIDLYALSADLYGKIGEADIQSLACTPEDRTHFNAAGARAMLSLIVSRLPEAEPRLAAYLRPPSP